MRPISAFLSPAVLVLPIVLAGTLATHAMAFDSADPFGTKTITPAPPRLALEPEARFIPCAPVETTRYGVLEVVDRVHGGDGFFLEHRPSAVLVLKGQHAVLPIDQNAAQLAPTGLVLATTQMLGMRFNHWVRFVLPMVGFVLGFGALLLVAQVMLA